MHSQMFVSVYDFAKRKIYMKILNDYTGVSCGVWVCITPSSVPSATPLHTTDMSPEWHINGHTQWCMYGPRFVYSLYSFRSNGALIIWFASDVLSGSGTTKTSLGSHVHIKRHNFTLFLMNVFTCLVGNSGFKTGYPFMRSSVNFCKQHYYRYYYVYI